MNRYALIEELSFAISYNRDLGLRAPAKILEHASTEASIHVTQHLIALQQLKHGEARLVRQHTSRTNARTYFELVDND